MTALGDAALVGRLAGAGVVFTEHGRGYLELRKKKRVLANQVIFRLPSTHLAVREFARQALVDVEGFPADRVQVLCNGVQAAPRSDIKPPETLRAQLGLRPRAPIGGICARLSPEKSLGMLLEAERLARVQHPDRHLVIAGDGPERALLEQTRQKSGLTCAVHLLGFRDDVSALVRMFDVFASPSLTEGTSVTLLEAMLAVRPVGATRVGGNPEIVGHGVSRRIKRRRGHGVSNRLIATESSASRRFW